MSLVAAKGIYRIRFHLQHGPNYLQWQVRRRNTIISYHEPDSTHIVMSGCILKNITYMANKFHNGAAKDVCAWVECENYHLLGGIPESECGSEIRFNPRIAPYWTDSEGMNIDNTSYAGIISVGRRLYVLGQGGEERAT